MKLIASVSAFIILAIPGCGGLSGRGDYTGNVTAVQDEVKSRNLVMEILIAGSTGRGSVKKSADTAAYGGKESDKILVNLSKDILKTIKARDYKALAAYVHPESGIRFTPYSYVDIKKDRKMTIDLLINITQPEKRLLWGEYDGSGEPINMTIAEYFGRFVYDADFLTMGEVSVNEVVQSGNTANNIAEAYPGCMFTEFMIPGIDPQYEGADWRVLRLVFKIEKDKIYLIAIIHNGFTT